MKIKILITIMILMPSISFGEWSQEKTARELFFAVALMKDWCQTTEIARSPYRREKNKILGSKPHQDNVHIYFSGCLLGHALVAYLLPNDYAQIWQDIWIGIESNTSDNNVLKGHKEYAHVGYRITHTIKF